MLQRENEVRIDNALSGTYESQVVRPRIIEIEFLKFRREFRLVGTRHLRREAGRMERAVDAPRLLRKICLERFGGRCCAKRGGRESKNRFFNRHFIFLFISLPFVRRAHEREESLISLPAASSYSLYGYKRNRNAAKTVYPILIEIVNRFMSALCPFVYSFCYTEK